uniref:Uncharacterized protein n=1 Tax=Cacopsylla melanoneura TaxID=428564 RepID=A0A8D8X9Y8_9HEMI
MEIMGSRLVALPAVLPALPHHHPIRTSLSGQDAIIPHPHDGSYLARFLGAVPPARNTMAAEATAFLNLNALGRIRLATLYIATQYAAMTTLCYDYSITGTGIGQWMGGGAALHSNVLCVMSSKVNLKTGKEEAMAFEPKALTQMRTAFKVWMGANVFDNLWLSQDWIGRRGETPAGPAVFFQLGNPGYAPRMCNPLAIDNFLIARPMEWAICGPKTKLDFTSELDITSGSPI